MTSAWARGAAARAAPDVGVIDAQGNTLAHLAAGSWHQSPGLYDELKRRGVNLEAVNHAGERALQVALRLGLTHPEGKAYPLPTGIPDDWGFDGLKRLLRAGARKTPDLLASALAALEARRISDRAGALLKTLLK